MRPPQPDGRRLSSVALLMKVITMLRLFSDIVLCVEPGVCHCRLSVHGDVAVVPSEHGLGVGEDHQVSAGERGSICAAPPKPYSLSAVCSAPSRNTCFKASMVV